MKISGGRRRVFTREGVARGLDSRHASEAESRERPQGGFASTSMNFPDLRLPPIFIVDDCEDDVFLLRHRLREGGIANPIATFDSPTEALAHLHFLPAEHPKPFLVFTDIRMPHESGFELLARIREEPQWDTIKVAVMSASNHPADLERALELGVAGYLIKFPPADLLAEFVTHGPWFAVSARTKSLTHPLSA